MAGSRVHLLIHGIVQGVSFRAYAREEAARLKLTGWVRNLSNGDVEAIAEGEDAALKKFVAWCHTGSPEARVESVKETSEPATGEFKNFSVTR
jgi:acylphosphatase